MICPNCNSVIDDNSTSCPYCSNPASAVTEDTDNLQNYSFVMTQDNAPKTSDKKKKIILIFLCVILIAALIGGIVYFAVLKKNVGSSDSKDGKKSASQETVTKDSVMKIGDVSISSAVYRYYYLNAYYEFRNRADQYDNYYGAGAGLQYVGFDSSKVPADQKFPSALEGFEDPTWDDYFGYYAKMQIQMYTAFTQFAKEKGITITDEQSEEIETAVSQLKSFADDADYTLNQYIEARFGKGVDEKLLRELFKTQYIAQNCNERIKQDTEDSTTQEELSKFAEENGIDTSLNAKGVDVRHILFKFGGDTVEQKAEAEAKAKEIYSEYLKNPTEENFASLANQYSEDTGSNTNGGLYEAVYPGTMVEEFNDWMFDPSRKPGDTGIVETVYGYHIMYYAGNNHPEQWVKQAKEDLTDKKVNEYYDELILKDEYKITEDEEKIANLKKEINDFIVTLLKTS